MEQIPTTSKSMVIIRIFVACLILSTDAQEAGEGGGGGH